MSHGFHAVAHTKLMSRDSVFRPLAKRASCKQGFTLLPACHQKQQQCRQLGGPARTIKINVELSALHSTISIPIHSGSAAIAQDRAGVVNNALVAGSRSTMPEIDVAAVDEMRFGMARAHCFDDLQSTDVGRDAILGVFVVFAGESKVEV